MLRKFITIALIVAVEYVLAAAALLFGISMGLSSPHSVGALGAGLAALAALAAILIGKRIGRQEARDEGVAELAAAPVLEAAKPAPAPAEQRQPEPRPAPTPPPQRDAAPSGPLLVDGARAIPIGFAALDRDLVIRSVNPALQTMLRAAGGGELEGAPLHRTALGAAVYNGPRTALAGRTLAELATDLLQTEGTLDLSRLLVPGGGERWATRLRARLHGWPEQGGRPDRFFLWVEEENPTAESIPPIPTPPPMAPSTGDREKLFDEILLRSALLAAIPVGVLLLDRRGHLLGWSDAVETTLGEEITLREAMPIAKAWPPLAAAPHAERLADLLASGAAFSTRIPARTAGGQPQLPKEQLVRGVPVGVPGEAPRQFLILIEERWDALAMSSQQSEVERARARERVVSERLPLVRSRLDLIGSITRFLSSMLSRQEVRALSELQMIDIQAERIGSLISEIESPPSVPPGPTKTA